MQEYLAKTPDESFDDYNVRLFERKKEYGITCTEIAELLNQHSPHGPKGESAWRKAYKNFNRGRIYEQGHNTASTSDEDLKLLKQEIQKERYKLQSEKLQLNEWLRKEARNELINEKIIDAIKSKKTDFRSIIPIYPPKNNKSETCLCIADMHFGKEYKLYGLNNEVINEYSPEIFYSRMEELLREVIYYVKAKNITYLKVFNLADTLDGFLRNSQIWTLKYGVIDSSIILGKYLAHWFSQLSKEIFIEYHPTVGNHGELRLLDGLKDQHQNDNAEKIVNEIIQIINEDNPNFKMVTNKTGLIFSDIAGFKLLGIHGEIKDPVQSIKDFSDIYNVNLNILLTGHKHHGSFVNCGYRKNAIGIGSIVGTDNFSLKIRKQADATANIITFERDKGKVDEHVVYLN